MENHHHHFRHFRHSDAWHHLVIQCLYQTFRKYPQIESLRQQGIQFDIGSCTVGEESKPCVRVMKKQCGYGKNGDFCVIDPK